jgi:hypothetical protein
MEEGLNEKRQPAGLALLLGIASLRPPNQKRSDLFNPFSIPLLKPKTRCGSRSAASSFADFADHSLLRRFRTLGDTLKVAKSF